MLPQLLDREEVPATFHEIGIQSGYRRPHCSTGECLLSAFVPSNETVNFWTHFVPSVFFFAKLSAWLANAEFREDPYNWPFLSYMATVCAWPMISCLAHLFCILSEDARHICFFVDYMGLAWYSFGVAVVYHAYCFDSVFFNTWYSGSYLSVSFVMSVLCVILACFSRFVSRHRTRKALRVFSFVLPYVVVNFPLVERIAHCGWSQCQDASIWQHGRQFFFASLGILIYSLHLPERFYPRKFDILGHSHQLFHVCGVIASYDQVTACLTDLRERRGLMRRHHSLPTGARDLFMVFALFLVQLAVVAFYMYQLRYRNMVPAPSTDDLPKKTDPTTLHEHQH